jgi:hypothetical protein
MDSCGLLQSKNDSHTSYRLSENNLGALPAAIS